MHLATPAVTLITTTLVIGGCSGLPEVPGCADDSAKKSVINIVKRSEEAPADEFRFELDYIKVTDRNERTGAYSCDAQLYIASRDERIRYGNIEYTISESAEDSSRFIVEVNVTHRR